MNKFVLTLLGAAVLSGITIALDKSSKAADDKSDRAAKREEAKAEKAETMAEAKAEAKAEVAEWLKEFSHYDMFRRIYAKNPSEILKPAAINSRRCLAELMPRDLSDAVITRNCLSTGEDISFLSDDALWDVITEEVTMYNELLEAKKTASK